MLKSKNIICKLPATKAAKIETPSIKTTTYFYSGFNVNGIQFDQIFYYVSN